MFGSKRSRDALVSRSDRVDGMCAGIPLDHYPHPAPLKVLPGLQLHSVEIFTLEYGFNPFRFRGIEGGVFDRRITPVAEFAMVPDAAERTGNPEHDEPIRAIWGRDLRRAHQC